MTPRRSTAPPRGSASGASRCRCSLPAILVALIFRTLDALRIFDLPFVLTGGTNGTSTLSLIAQKELTTNNLIGYGSALSVLTFVIVMAVSFIYIKSVGGNIRSLAEED